MEHTSEEVPVLVAQAGPLNGQRWYLQLETTIGRDASCDIVIADRQISRHHARLKVTPTGVILEDLGSKNGTHRNGQRVEAPIMLLDGDTVQIALAQQFTFLSSDATLPLDDDISRIEGGMSRITYRLQLEKRSRRVWLGSEEVLPPLSVSQYKLLELLYDNQGRVVPRQRLIETVWDVEQAISVSEQALDALVRRLRERLAAIDPDHTYIATVRGHGLRLDNPEREGEA